jgi:glycosyltransferase involved in cell wall biosynthesis
LGVPAAQARRYRAICEASFDGSGRTWLDPSPDVRQLIAASDVVVVPSVWQEPSGLAVSEALATGTPVVASRTGGIPAQMPDSPLVALVQPGKPDELAAAIRRVAAVQPTAERRQALRAHISARRSLRTVSERYLATLRGP